MKAQSHIMTLELPSLAGLKRMRRIISEIETQQPQLVLVKSASDSQFDADSIEYRDYLLAHCDEFVKGTFNLRAYRNKAHQMIEKFRSNMDEELWWQQGALLITKLLHLALTEIGNSTLWIDAQQFNSHNDPQHRLQELWDHSQGHIVISQDSLCA